MGHMIQEVAARRGHQIATIIDSADAPDWESGVLTTVDVAIEFTIPQVAANNCRRLTELGIPTVSGTTGWAEELRQLQVELQQNPRGALLWASNFSIGVNLFFLISKQVARLMEHASDYRPELEETHHIHKLDAPSGTAITLAEGLIESMPTQLQAWQLVADPAATPPGTLPITSIREGEVAGIHQVTYRSGVDAITLRHEAFSREGFALGAVMAAEYLAGRQGVYTMQDLLNHFLEN